MKNSVINSHCMSLFLLMNTKEDILKNVGNQTVDGIDFVNILFLQWKSIPYPNNYKFGYKIFILGGLFF